MINKLKVEGNKIIDSNGEEIVFRGININSPGILKYEEDHDFLNDIKEIKKLGANAIRVPICPAYWQLKENYLSNILNPLVNLTKELNLYCCLDWHAQGNPYENKTREFGNDLINGFEKYDAKKEVALNALEIISKRYGKRKHIIFEVFGVPTDIENNDWIEVSQKFVNKVRENTENIIIINGTNWTSDLNWVLKNPIKSKNIVYGFCYYLKEIFQNKEKMIRELRNKYPVIFPECGYTEEGYFKGTKENYGQKLKNYITEDKISFFAWAYHPKRVPIILNSWNPNDLTEWGRFLKEELLNKK